MERDREIEIDRKTDRQIELLTGRQTERQTKFGHPMKGEKESEHIILLISFDALEVDSACQGPVADSKSKDHEGGSTFVEYISSKLASTKVAEYHKFISTMLNITEWAVGIISVYSIYLGRPRALRSAVLSVHPGV